MASSYQVPDLVRIQTIVNALSNEAQWAYVTRPDTVDAIADVLVAAMGRITDGWIAAGRVCPDGYCRDGVVCTPCELPRWRSDPQSRPGAPRGAARTRTTDGSRRTKPDTAVASRRDRARPR
jgi:hypothetical protein